MLILMSALVRTIAGRVIRGQTIFEFVSSILNLWRPMALKMDSLKLKSQRVSARFQKSYINNLFSKATKLNLTKVSWVILLFEYEYSARLTGVDKDEYLTFIGAFNYDDEAENVYEIEEPA